MSLNCALYTTAFFIMIDTKTYHWYALRATYGRELKAYEYLLSQNITTFCPTIKKVRQVDGKRKTVVEACFPNILFAFCTFEQLKPLVFNNPDIPFLRFYCCRIRFDNKIKNVPIVIPNSQMENLKIICNAGVADIIVCEEKKEFSKGKLVKVVDGSFKGVTGRVVRYQGQKRVAIQIEGLMTVCTAYVPSAFCKDLNSN